MKTVATVVTMLLVRGVRSGDSADNLAVTGYTDTCDYTDYYVKCGDQCISESALCYCGSSDAFLPYWDDELCCIPSGGSCTKEPGNYGDGICSEGRTLSMSSHCDNTNLPPHLCPLA